MNPSIQQRYREALEYMYAQLPMFQRIGPAAFKKDLTNIVALMEALGNPHQRFRSVHVAGTNGKGSVSHMLAAVFQAHGLKTGLYISPHYRDFRERIKINGRYVPKSYVVDFVDRHGGLFGQIRPSFFEITVAMAFDYFARQQVDVAVVEVGMGGRLDSTNVISPLLSVITNISYDHMQFLGDTLPLIAGEKAGIIKEGVPVVIGETHPETAPVFLARAAEKHAPITFADQQLQAEPLSASLEHTTFDVRAKDEWRYRDLEVNVRAMYQRLNLQTTLQALEVLKQAGYFPLREDRIREGLRNLKALTRFIGRWQVIGEKPLVLLDSAHNEGGIRTVMAQVLQQEYRQLHIVLGMVSDKEVEKVLPLFPEQARYYFAKANIPRGLDAGILREKAALFGLQGRAYSSVRNALRAARRAAAPEDLIFVGGSIFVVAEVV